MSEDIKKVTVSYEDLPPINSIEAGYFFNYRVTSENSDNQSHWSPLFFIKPEYSYGVGTLTATHSGGILSYSFTAVSVKKGVTKIATAKNYDIWVRWYRTGTSGDWININRSPETAGRINVPATYTISGVVQGSAPNKVDVEIYVEGDPATRGDGVPLAIGTNFLKVYQQLEITV